MRRTARSFVVGAIFLAAGAAGCGPAVLERAPPKFPLYWGKIDADRPSVWIVPLGEQSFEANEIRLTVPEKAVEVRLLLVNCTGEPLFVRHDLSEPLRHLDFKVKATRKTGEWTTPEVFSMPVDRPEAYVLLSPTELLPFPDGLWPKRWRTASLYVTFRVELPVDTCFADVDFAWGVYYFTDTDTQGTSIKVEKHMRIVFED